MTEDYEDDAGALVCVSVDHGASVVELFPGNFHHRATENAQRHREELPCRSLTLRLAVPIVLILRSRNSRALLLSSNGDLNA